MLRTSKSTDSSTSAIQITFEYDGVDGSGGNLVKKSSKSQRIVKSQRTSRPEKSIGSEEPSLLTSNTRLAFTKIGSRHTKLTMENCWLLKPLRIGSPTKCKLEVLVLTDHTSDDLEIRKARASVRFTGLKSSLDTTFASIVDKAKLVELLMLCRVFPQRSQEDLRAENTQVHHQL